MKWQNVRFVHLLSSFVGIAMISMMILQWSVSYIEAKLSLYTTAFLLNAESANRMSVTMNTVFRSMENTLAGNAKHIAEQVELGSPIQPHVDHFMESNNFFNEIIVVDHTGKIVATSEKEAGGIESIVSGSSARQLLEAQKPAISEPFQTDMGNLIVLMTHPIVNAKGEYYGYLGGTIHLHEDNVLNEIFGTNDNGLTGTYTYVVDPKGHLLYHPDPNRLGDIEFPNTVVQKVLKGQNGFEEVTNTRGKVFAAGYAPVTENGWGIVVQTPVEAIRYQALGIIFKEMVYTLPIFLLLFFMTIILARKIAAPFSSLASAAEQYMSGKPVKDLPRTALSSYEAHQLYKTVLLAMDKLQKRADQFLVEAQTDALTGLANRRTMNALMEKWIAEKRPFAVVSIDIDFFKKVNDTYGHQVGDQVLQFLAATLEANTRQNDTCCRYGGEEFIILLPETPIATAYQIAERIRTTLENTNSPTGKPITVSCGVSVYPDHGKTVQELLNCADKALYTAKHQGRNQTVIYRHGRD